MLQSLHNRLDVIAGSPWWWTFISCLNFAISILIIRKVSYTEIDWIAYMQEVEGPLIQGQWDYLYLRGDTGPLVYPAGFVYVFMLLRWLTDSGTNILRAQYIFAVIHSILVWFVLGSLYHDQNKRAKKLPFWISFLVILSRRIHSIFELRLFNDGVAMVFLYVSLFYLVRRQWTKSCIFFNFAFSIKMNIILFAPGLAVILLESIGFFSTLVLALSSAVFQLGIAYPFLIANAKGYFTRSFELGRVFDYKWTVNFRFLPEEIFLQKELAMGLLVCTLIAWLFFGHKHFVRTNARGLFGLIIGALTHPFTAPSGTRKSSAQDTDHILKTMFMSNFIGIVFSRSIHYQFYCWYYHTLAYLSFISLSRFPYLIMMIGTSAVLAGIEFAYNVYPSTYTSSIVLQVCHGVLFVLLWFTPTFFISDGKKHKSI